MSKLIFFIFSIISVFANSQILGKDFTWLNQNHYKSVKEIKIYKNGKLGIIQEFDKAGNPTFVKNNGFNGDNIFAVWGFSYQNEKLKAIIFGHSNIGFSESEYVYSKNKTETYTYQEIVDNYEVNSFPYQNEIKNINSRDDLLNSKSLNNLKKGERFLFQVDEFNDNGKISTSIVKDSKGEQQTVTLYSYSKNREKIEFKTGDKNFDNEILKEFDQKGNLLKEKYKNIEISYSYIDDLLMKKSTFESGELRESVTYEYNTDKKLTQKKTFVADYDKTFYDKYEYNEKGFLKNVEMENIEGNSKYNYEYIYW